MTNTSSQVDLRESLVNDRTTGLITAVQIPTERITRLHAIFFDLDPKWLRSQNPLFPPADEPAAFFESIRPVLDRHPLTQHAEVRVSGSGLHVLLWLEPAVELHSAAEQQTWSHIVKAVQRTLPVDPNLPGITALTRPVGSINGKNGQPVRTLRTGEPVSPEDVLAYVDRLQEAPFREVAMPLLGGPSLTPCPVCRGHDTELKVGDTVGFCYDWCGKISLDRLLDVLYQPGELQRPAGLPGDASVRTAGKRVPYHAAPTSAERN